MSDYIAKNEVLNLIMHNDKVCHYADERYENVVYATACRIGDVVANMPAADVQLMKYGRWIGINEYCKKNGYIPSGMGIYYWCSECGKEESKISDYCPNCGARMDGDK